MDGCRSSREGAAGGSASLRCLFLGGHLFPSSPASPPPPGIIHGESLSWELALDCPSGDLWSSRQGLWASPSARCDLGEAALPPPSSGRLGSKGNVLESPARGHSHPWERRGSHNLYFFLGKAGSGWVLLPLYSPPSGTHSGISRALSEHCLQHLLPRQGPDLCQDFFKVFLKTTTRNQVSLLQPSLPPRTASSFLWGRRRRREG